MQQPSVTGKRARRGAARLEKARAREEINMTDSTLDVVGIGNAILDVLTQAEESLLEQEGLPKGGMTLIDEQRAHEIYSDMGPSVETSGGSAANTLAGIASLGGNCGFIGKVRNDQLGEIFRHDIQAAGTVFRCSPAETGPATARCFIFVTPDAQRTMATYLGASVHFSPEDLDAELITSAKVLYLEGYLWDAPPAKQAFLEAADIAHKAGRQVALTLSDSFCVQRHKADFLRLIDDHIDILFANEAEITTLYDTDDFDEAVAALIREGHCATSAVTRGSQGSIVIQGDQVLPIAVQPQGELVNTTGAGDLYAAGFLYGYTRGMELAAAGKLGSLAAGEIVTQMGPRPAKPLKKLVESRG